MSDVPPPPPPSSAPPKKRRWLRRLVLFVVFLAAIVTAAPLALGLKPVRELVASKVSKALGRTTTIGGASGSWWGGFELRDVEVRNPEGWQGDPLFSLDSVKVDVKFLKLVTGSIDATVDVEKPVVTLLRAADGRSNADGLMPEDEKAAKEPKASKSGSSMPRLVLRVRNGRVVAQDLPVAGTPVTAPDELDAITLDVETGPDGHKSAAFSAVAKRSARGGGDATITMSTALSGTNEGPVSLSIPTLDLARVARLVASTTGLEGLTGAFDASAKLNLDAKGRASGSAVASLTGLSARKGDGRFRIEAAALDLKPSVVGEASAFDVTLAIKNLVATGYSNRDAGLNEPALTLVGKIVRQENGDLSFGTAAAPLTITGQSLSGTLSGAVRNVASDAAEADVKAHVGVVLSPTLGRLLGAISSPDDDLRGTLAIDATAAGKGGGLDLALNGSLRDVVVGGAAGATPFREPAISFGAAGAWDGKAKRLTLSKGSIAAGAMSAAVKPGFVVDAGERAGASGDATLDADFARLSTLKALVPSLDSVRAGKLHAEAKLASGDDMKADWSVRADGLTFAPGALSSTGYVEPAVVLRGSFEKTKSGDMVVGLAELSSSIASLRPSPAGLRIRMSDAGPAVESPGTLTIKLDALGRAMDLAMGLKPGESLGGVLDVTPTGSTTATGGAFSVALAGREVRFPGAPAGTLTGKIDGRTDKASKTTTIDSATLDGYGLAVKANASMGPDAAGATALRSAHATVTGDLATARPLLGVFMGLAPDAVLAGSLASDVAITPAGASRTVRGRTTLERLHFVGGRDPKNPKASPTTFDEPSVIVEHDLTLDFDGKDSMRLDKVTLASAAVSAAAGGSTHGTGESRTLDLVLKLDADCGKLADRLRKVLGEGYEDTAGTGRITGQFVLVGPTANQMRDLKIDGNLAYGSLTSGGLTISNGQVRVVRPNPATPVALTMTSTVNRGTLRLDGSCDLGRGESPWNTKLAIKGLDTSPLLTNRGAGKYLTLVLPAIIPAEATSNILSGLLDADLDLRSLSKDAPRLTDTLSGPGSIRMVGGSVKDSTIFSSLGGEGAGKGIAALIQLAPGVGKEFQSLSKALLFQTLSSTFTIGNRKIDLNPVEMKSPSMELRFSGIVGFDGSTDLKIPLKLAGDAGKAVEPYLPDRTIPLHVTGKTGSLHVTPEISAESLAKSGLLEKGKDALDGLLGGKKKKPK